MTVILGSIKFCLAHVPMFPAYRHAGNVLLVLSVCIPRTCLAATDSYVFDNKNWWVGWGVGP